MGFGRLLKKNKNEYFTYNIGVMLLRIAVVLTAAAVFLIIYSVFDTPDTIKSMGIQEITVTDVQENHTRYYDDDRVRKRYYYYYAELKTQEGEKFIQKLSKSEYNALYGESTVCKPLYITNEGKFYVQLNGETNAAEATREYYGRFPTAGMIARKWCIAICFGVELASAAGSFAEFRIAKRYRKPYIDDNSVIDPAKKAAYDKKADENSKLEMEFENAVSKGSRYDAKLAGIRNRINKASHNEYKSLNPEERHKKQEEIDDLLEEFDRIIEQHPEKYNYKN